MPSTRKYTELKRYRQALKQQFSFIPCFDCKRFLIAKDLEKHCFTRHSFNSKRLCVWCYGHYSWDLGRKHCHVKHLQQCMKQFIKYYQILDTNEPVHTFSARFLQEICIESTQNPNRQYDSLPVPYEFESTFPALSTTDCANILHRIEPTEHFDDPPNGDYPPVVISYESESTFPASSSTDPPAEPVFNALHWNSTRLTYLNQVTVSYEQEPTFPSTSDYSFSNKTLLKPVENFVYPQSADKPTTLTPLDPVAVHSEPEPTPTEYEKCLQFLSTESAESIFESLKQSFKSDYNELKKRLEKSEKGVEQLKKENEAIKEELKKWEENYFMWEDL